MKQPHKNAEFIKAWADGFEIEYWDNSQNGWVTSIEPHWNGDRDFRIKPNPDFSCFIVIRKMYKRSDSFFNYYQVKQDGPDKQVQVTFDGETGEPKSAKLVS